MHVRQRFFRAAVAKLQGGPVLLEQPVHHGLPAAVETLERPVGVPGLGVGGEHRQRDGVVAIDDDRAGQLVGRRLSSATLDYDQNSPGYDAVHKALLLTGTGFGANRTLVTTVLLDKNHPTNPFRHRYNPDHDNLDPNRPIYDQARFHVDASVGYRLRFANDKVRLNLQLNVRDVFEDGSLRPVGANPDGSIYASRIIEPRGFIFTATFDL